jgi:acetyl-CoA synthetase
MQPGRDHWWEELVASQPEEAPTESVDAETTLMIIYTSGTTGTPKGRRAYALRLPNQGHPGHGLRHRCAPGRRGVLDDRHGLDDGPVAGVWGAAAGGDLLIYDGAPDYPGRTGCGSWWSATASACWAFRRP